MTRKSPSLPRLNAHFVGIGGIGISALARWFLAQNWAVSGSDLADSQIVADLRKAGVKVKIGQKQANLPKKGLDMVIYSSAVPYSNPELVEARRRGVKPLSYPEVVGCLTKVYRTIAIAGSHGKSTTTALTSLVLMKAKLDPNVILGTNLKEFGNSNFRKGRSKWLVLEADEWSASFLNYYPEITVVTNIDKEHLDFYKNLANVKKIFLKFLGNTKVGGYLVLNRDDKALFSLKSPILKLAVKNKLEVYWYSLNDRGSRIEDRGLRKVLKIPGEHNVSNAMAALSVARILKIKLSVALRALGSYTGAWRRFEYKGRFQVSGVRCQVFDDYAHHPTEIKATLQAFREKFPKSKLVCVYQPHQAKRLRALFKEFVGAFELADILILLPVYEVAGRDKTSSGFTSQKLVDVIKKKYPKKEVYYLPSPKRIRNMLHDTCEKFHYDHCVVVMMGAGDIVNYTPLLLHK
ncbi:MAG: UDP-N-acetylmuramate--L-alanine ligase [Candidatus Liptonbacteria bacterium]|nr:UDP-N-acetylmuramate--L-alanine ligase [Candidatus Liptonbacteria bacterium]